MKIIVIDDDNLVAISLKTILEATGKIEEYFSAFYGFLWVLPVKTGVLIVRISSA